jgi:hypothetical protein
LPGEDSVIKKTARETRIMVRRSIRIRLTMNFAMIYLAVVDNASGPNLTITSSESL